MSAQTYQSLIDQISKMSVKELAEAVKALEEHFGVKAAVGGAAAPAAAAAPTAEAKSSFTVKLEAAGDKKIEVIKALRAAVPTLSLTDAKKAVEEAPSVIGNDVPSEEAKKMKAALEAAGAKVSLS